MTKSLVLFTTATLWTLTFVEGFFNVFPKFQVPERERGDAGQPLFLTKYVENGNIEEGRRSANVPWTAAVNVSSYAGFFTVNKTYDANLFFWYFPVIEPDDDAPVLLWLQGGPGATSLFGLFEEHGPIQIENGNITRRETTWALNHHLIYVDNPIGTGFSFTKDARGFCEDEEQISQYMYAALIQFFTLFPNLQSNQFYISGESYAGKYVPAIAYKIHESNPNAHLKLNLKGLAIGNGWSDPEHQHLYSSYLYQLGLIDDKRSERLRKIENVVVKYIKTKKWSLAQFTSSLLLEKIMKFTGGVSIYNYVGDKFFSMEYGELIQKNEIRKALHVGEVDFNPSSMDVMKNLLNDMMQSVAPMISNLLEHYKITFYSGQLDIIVCYPSTVNFLKNLDFAGKDKYAAANREIWKADGEVAGYVKQAGNLVEVLVRNAGHNVPSDQPKWALDMITRITHQDKFI